MGISIHAPLTGSDFSCRSRGSALPYFNPRSPHGERHSSYYRRNGAQNISIHAPLTGSDLCASSLSSLMYISIHAPLTGSDGRLNTSARTGIAFQSTLPSRGATRRRRRRTLSSAFQSTLPSRGATTYSTTRCARAAHFNPRSPHGERLFARLVDAALDISIHAPLTGSDIDMGGEAYEMTISIHAPLTGSDPHTLQYSPFSLGFQSTLPSRGATRIGAGALMIISISIHAPLTGSDRI